MSHKFNPKKMNKLDTPQRRLILPPLETLIEFGLQKEDSFLDIGCGVGYFTIPAAEFLDPKQIATGVDLSLKMIEELQIRATKRNINNLKLILSEEYDLKVKDSSQDFALMVNVLHEIDDKNKFMKKIHSALSETGKLAIIEWAKIPTEEGPPVQYRIDEKYCIQLFEENGFKILSKHRFSESFYGLVGVKNG